MGYVYKITCVPTGKAYIGISIHEPEKRRIKAHLSGRGNQLLARAVKKYGKDAFTYEVLEADVFDEFLPDLEIAYIAELNTVVPHGFNLTHGGPAPLKGRKHSEESRRKMSEAHKGKKHSAETRRKMSEAHKRRMSFKKNRRKVSEFHKGRKRSAETRRKLSEASKGNQKFLGKKHSAETRRKISEAQKGNKSGLHPIYIPARDYFFSLPSDMPLRDKRKLFFTKFSTSVSRNTIYRWIKEWQSSD